MSVLLKRDDGGARGRSPPLTPPETPGVPLASMAPARRCRRGTPPRAAARLEEARGVEGRRVGSSSSYALPGIAARAKTESEASTPSRIGDASVGAHGPCVGACALTARFTGTIRVCTAAGRGASLPARGVGRAAAGLQTQH
eukprot:364318-Chlamydomonas_euryale.AAC.6